ncbi:MAG: PAS domain S-box protein [Halobacteriales archaeon]
MNEVSSGSVQVIHVDDDRGFAGMTANFIERQEERLNVETTTDPDEALEHIRTNDVNCVVSDYDMAEQSGIEFLETVREEYPDLPFILYTGKGSEEVASEAISAGVTDYLQKGTGTSQYEVLTNRIKNAVEQQRARKQVAETEQRLRSIAENTNDILWQFTGDWDELLFINSSCEEICGRSIEELNEQPRSFLEDVHPDDRPEVEAAMERLSTGDSMDFEFRVEADEDYGRWVWVQGEPIMADSGQVEKVVGFARDITERKTREQELEAARSDYEALFEASPVPIWVQGLREIYYANEAAAQFHGVNDPDELIGRSAMEFVPENELDETLRRNRRMLEEGESTEEKQGTMVTDDDELRQAIFSAAPITYRGEQALVAFALDISERQDREARLEAERERFRTLFEQLTQPAIEVEYEGSEPIVKEVNPAFEEAFGYDETTLLNESIDEYIVPDEFEDQAKDINQRVREGGRLVSEEVTRMTADGPREFLLQNAVYEDGSGGFAVYMDVTDRKRHAEQLRALHERSRILMGADAKQEVADVGIDAAREVLGLDACSIHLYNGDQPALVPVAATELTHELVGEPPVFLEGTSIAWRAYDQGEALAIDDVKDHPDAYNAETPMRSELYLPLGEYGILLAGSPDAGSFDGQDLALGKVLAANITSALDQVVQQERLRTREAELTRQNDRLAEFASIVSHDLRNPLSVAEGGLELAREECQSEQLDRIDHALQRMDDLIDDLLTLAREGETVTDPEPVDIPALVEDCWATVETAEAKLEIDIDRTISADESRLKQVLENLIRNAVEHGGEAVTVTIGELDSGFYVEDDGPGIPESDRDQIFEAGYSTNEAGNGIGLSIVEQIIQAHGWGIQVTAGRDGGTRFEITGIEVPD